jgi:hypothetical protein
MYTNSTAQISLEEAYKKVYTNNKKHSKESCDDSCSDNDECGCKKKKNIKTESIDVPPSIDAALDAGQQIVYNGDDTVSELRKFLPLVFSSAASDLGYDDQKSAAIAEYLVSKIDFNVLETRLSQLHDEKEKLTDEAKYNMEAQVKLNKVIDQFLKEGTLEALDVLYNNPSNNMPPSKVVKALEKQIEDRISSRK